MKRIKLFAIFLVVLAGLAGLSYTLWGDSVHQEETKPVLSVVSLVSTVWTVLYTLTMK